MTNPITAWSSGKVDSGEVAANVWAAPARTLSALALENLLDYSLPLSHYPVTLIVSSGAANVFGAWTQLIADVGVGKQLRGVIVTANHGYQVSNQIEIGVGAAPNEAPIYRFTWRDHLKATDTGWIPPFYIPVDVLLADNARLSARVRIEQAAVYGAFISSVVV